MQPWGAGRLLIIGLLTGGLIASGATPVGARPHKPPKTTLTARVVPGAVPVGEPATLAIRLRPASRGVRLVVQQRTGTRWTTLARPRTDADGNARVRLQTTTAGPRQLRVLRASPQRSRRAVSRPVRLTVAAAAPCTPRPALVDPQAGRAARCLAARIDRWQAAGAMGVGQQLNVSNTAYLTPVTALGGRAVKVVGFDLKELGDGETYQFADPPLARLVALAQAGAVLSASWHPANPRTGGSYADRSWHDLGALLDSSTPEYARFWADYAAQVELLRRFQDAGVAVVLRPLHEANGDWFWWGHPDPATYRKVWALMQRKTWEAGVHNVVWAYSFNAVTGANTTDPVRLLPDRVDLAGLDAYDDESGNPRDQLPVGGYDAVAARVERTAITEAGPHDSADGSWDPAVISRAARTLTTPPAWSMLWFDDGTGKKQIASLRRGPAWLASCRGGFCDVGP